MISDGQVNKLLDHLFRQEYGKVISYLTSIFGFDKLPEMEDIAQETLLEAYKNWSYHGIPPDPARWIFKVAKNKAINFSKREQKKGEVYRRFGEKQFQVLEADLLSEKEIQDSVLRMIFVCASLDLSMSNIILLVLNTLCGFTRKEIANAMLMDEEAVKKRLFRAKKKVRHETVPLLLQKDPVLNDGLNSVLTCLYLLFNEGYNSTHKDDLIRKDLCLEAIRLTKIVVDSFKADTRSRALLALMYFHAARFDSRIDDKGAIILIKDQNRKKWDKDLINLGVLYLSKASVSNQLSAYHIEAAIAAEYCKATCFDQTNWSRIYKLYEKLLEFKPNPIIELNMAIVTSKIGSVEVAISQLMDLGRKHKQLRNYYLFYATLGELYSQEQSWVLAKQQFEKAASLTKSAKEHKLLLGKISRLKA